MGLLDSNKFVLKSQDTNFSTKVDFSLDSAGYLCNNINVLPFQYICMNITLNSDSGRITLYINNGIHNDGFAYCIDSEGKKYKHITKSGNYFVDVSGLKSIRPYINAANSGSIIYSFSSTRPTAFDLNPIQTLISHDITLTNGQTFDTIATYALQEGMVLRYCKFYQLYVKSISSGGSALSVSSLSVSTADISETNVSYTSPYVLRAEGTDTSVLNTEWIPVCSPKIIIEVRRTAATAGDKIHIELRGIR